MPKKRLLSVLLTLPIALVLLAAPLCAQYAYVANYTSNTISEYAVGATGALTQFGSIAGGAAGSPLSLVVEPTARFVYLLNIQGIVSEYRIGPTGDLTPIGSIGNLVDYPISIAADPTGRFVYVGNDGTSSVSAYRIAPDGVLSLIGKVPALGQQLVSPVALTVEPKGRFVYAVDDYGSRVIGFRIGTAGALTPLGTLATASGPVSLVADASGKLLFVCDETANRILTYGIGSSGALTPIGSVVGGGDPFALAIDPTGKFVYVAEPAFGTVAGFSVGATGLLSFIGSTVAGPGNYSIAVDPSGRFVYTANLGISSVSAFSIGPTGTLTPIAGFVPSGAGPRSVAVSAVRTPDLLVTGTGPTPLPGPSGVENAVLRYDGKAGAYLGYFAGSVCRITDLTYGPDGRLYVLETYGRGYCTPPFLSTAVRRFNGQTGAFEDWDDDHASYVPYSGLSFPGGIAFGPDGNLYISNDTTAPPSPYGQGQVLRYQGPFGTSPGAFMDVFVPTGSGGLTEPGRLTFGPEGDLWVLSVGTNQLIRFRGPSGPNPGQYLGPWGTLMGGGINPVSGVAFGSDGSIYVGTINNVTRYGGPLSPNPGVWLGQIATGGTGGIAFGPANDLFVSAPGGVFRYNPITGASKGQFTSGGDGALLFTSVSWPVPGLGDFNNDACVDRTDLTLLTNAVNQKSTNRIYDLNGDGSVTIADSRKLTLLFTNPTGNPCN